MKSLKPMKPMKSIELIESRKTNQVNQSCAHEAYFFRNSFFYLVIYILRKQRQNLHFFLMY